VRLVGFLGEERYATVLAGLDTDGLGLFLVCCSHFAACVVGV